MMLNIGIEEITDPTYLTKWMMIGGLQRWKAIDNINKWGITREHSQDQKMLVSNTNSDRHQQPLAQC